MGTGQWKLSRYPRLRVETIHGLPNTPNTNRPVITAAFAGVDVNVQAVNFGTTNKTPAFLKKFPFGKIPAMETPEGPVYESSAVAAYIARKHKSELLGRDAYSQSLVDQYVSSVNCELNPAMMKAVYPALGFLEYNPTQWTGDVTALIEKLRVYDSILLPSTYLVGEEITVADILLTCTLVPIYALILEENDRKSLLNLTRHFVTVANQKAFKSVAGEVKLCDKRVDPAKSRPSAAASSHGNDQEEEESAPKPKEKNALDLLPPSKLNLEEWKRFYSNCKETNPVATNWFWEHYDPEGFSIWRATYRYNDELQKIFMTCNLVSGLFARMDALRRYCFASVLIFGEDNKNEISGFFVFRGPEIPAMMKEVPDFDSYEWARMDTTDKKQVELFNEYLAWEGNLEGKSFNQGKVFK